MSDTIQDPEDTQLLAALPQIYSLAISCSNFRNFDLTKTQLMIMSALLSHSVLTMSQVAEYISSSREQATRTVDKLVENGYLERYTDSKNRTRVCIMLSSKGKQVMEKCRSEFVNLLSVRLHSHLTEEEILTFKNNVSSLIGILDKLL